MSNANNESQGCDVVCKNHTARTERDFYRICPSKLSKRELENLYFALLENNVDLKKTVHSQQERLKILSTKVQRLTSVQRTTAGKEKNCCTSKVLVNEQKELIVELKKANERMAERIRLLNMRLCSAKQFLKRSPSQSSKCVKCALAPTFKNSSMSAISYKPSENNMKMVCHNASCRHSMSKDDPESSKIMRTVETETDVPEKGDSEKHCDENRCRSIMDELKQKIVNLQEELSRTHDEYSGRISKLEGDVSALREENTQARAQRAATEYALAQRQNHAAELTAKLREVEGKISDLTMQLTIERRKVTELETALKLAESSNEVVKTIEKLNQQISQVEMDIPRSSSLTSKRSPEPAEPNITTTPRKDVPSPTSPQKSKDDVRNSKSDDSGYTDLNKSSETEEDKIMLKLNQEMLKKISDLQTQLDGLRIKAAGESVRETKDFYDSEQNNKTITPVVHDKPKIVIEMQEIGKFDFAEEKYSSTPIKDSGVSKFEEKQEFKSGRVERLGSVESVSSKKVKNETTKRSVSQNSYIQNNGDLYMSQSNKVEDSQNYQTPDPIPSSDLTTSNGNNKAFKSTKSKEGKGKNTSIVNEVSKDSFLKEYGERKDDENNKANKDENKFKRQVSVHPKSSILEPREEESRDSLVVEKLLQSEKDSIIQSHVTEYSDMENKLEAKPKLNAQDISSAGTELKASTLSSFRPTEAQAASLNQENICHAEKGTAEVGKVNRTACTSYIDDYVETQVEVKQDASPVQKIFPPGDSASANVIAGQPTRRDSATYTAPAVQFTRRDSATYTGTTGQPSRRDSATYTAPAVQPARRDSATYTKFDTSVHKSTGHSSPENTDHEISSLSDLPPEKDGKYPRVLSPGEQMTTTRTDTGTEHTTDYGSLSEGELPHSARNIRSRKLSFGEKPTYSSPVAPQEQMEATLNAISEELARCRQLLASSGHRENDPTIDLDPPSLALRPAPAARRLPHTHTHTCVFTLHIGTLVLSDEAIVNMRNKSLVLLWKFYEQSVTMTRMRPDRVVVFDFSTEYDVTYSDHFFNYMRQGEMPLVICEANKQDEPYATCSLPLRDALLHANRRADMSLALLAGPAMSARRDTDALVAGDELGVLDLWCVLHVDADLLASINHNITQSPVIGSKADNLEASYSRTDNRLSQDIALTAIDRGSRLYSKLWTSDFLPPRPVWEAEKTKEEKKISDIDDESASHIGPPRPYPSIMTTKYAPPKLMLRHRSSEVLANEVPANIRSTSEMKEALDRNVHLDAMRKTKTDDVVRPKVKHNKTSTAHGISDSWHGFLKKERKMSAIQAVTDIAQRHSVSHNRRNSTGFRTEGTDTGPNKNYSYNGFNRSIDLSKKTVKYNDQPTQFEDPSEQDIYNETQDQSIQITVLWLALNEESEAMANPNIERLYVAYSFLGQKGADLETPVSLPKPKHYTDKCYFNFKKTFHLHDADLPLLGHMSRCRASSSKASPRNCVVFTVVSEPPEDPLGLSTCEDIGHAYLYLGDVLAYSGGSVGYTGVVAVRAGAGAGAGDTCGALAVRVDGLHVLRSCLALSNSLYDLANVR